MYVKRTQSMTVWCVHNVPFCSREWSDSEEDRTCGAIIVGRVALSERTKGNPSSLPFSCCRLKDFSVWIRCFNNSLTSYCRLPSRMSCIMSGDNPSQAWKYLDVLRRQSLYTPQVVAMCSYNGPFSWEQWCWWLSRVCGWNSSAKN